MNELQTMKQKNLLKAIEETQKKIDAAGGNMLEWAIEQGEHFEQLVEQIKEDTAAWRKEHGAELRKAKRNEDEAEIKRIEATKPKSFDQWCEANREHVKADKSQRNRYRQLSGHGSWLKFAASKRQKLTIENAPKFIKHEPENIDSMTPEQIEAHWAKVNEEESFKEHKASPKKKESTATVDLVDYSNEEFLDAVQEFIPKQHVDEIMSSMGNIPNANQSLFLHSRSQVMASMSSLIKSDKRKLISALTQMAISQARAFDLLKPKYHKAAEAALKKATKAMKDKTAKLTADNVVAPKGSISNEEFKLIRSVLHSDREASPARKNKAFDIFNRAFGGE